MIPDFVFPLQRVLSVRYRNANVGALAWWRVHPLADVPGLLWSIPAGRLPL